MGAAIRQGFTVGSGVARFEALGVNRPQVGIRHGDTINEKLVLLHLDRIARQADDALDVVDLGVARQLEHHDIATSRRMVHDAALDERQGDRKGIFRDAVIPLGDDNVIAFIEIRLHRGRGDGERLEQEGAQDHHQDQGDGDDAEDFLGFIDRHLFGVTRIDNLFFRFVINGHDGFMVDLFCGTGRSGNRLIRSIFVLRHKDRPQVPLVCCGALLR